MCSGGSFELVARRAVAPVLMLLLAGCAMQGSGIEESPNYSLGFGDGCASASAVTTPSQQPTRRDEELYKDDAAYRAGWASGLSTCRMDTRPAPF